MKKIKYSILALATLLMMSSCNQDDYTGASNITFTAPTATFTSPDGNSVSVMETSIGENGVTYTITATLSEAVSFDTKINLKQTGGTATEGVDFQLSNILIPALTTTGIGTVTVFNTGDIEGDETLEITAGIDAPNVDGMGIFNYTITGDYINDKLDVSLAWAGSYTYNIAPLGAEVTIDYCEADFDLLLFDGAFGYIGYVLGTGSCPEPTESLSGLADGTYYLVADLWDNPFAALGTGQPLPLTLTYSQDYFPMTSGTIVNNSYTTDSSSGLAGVATITVTNGYEYTVTPF